MATNENLPRNFNNLQTAWDEKISKHEQQVYNLQNYNKPDFIAEKKFAIKTPDLPKPTLGLGKLKYTPELDKLKRKQQLELKCKDSVRVLAKMDAEYKKLLSLIANIPNKNVSNKLRSKLTMMKANLDYAYDKLQSASVDSMKVDELEKVHANVEKLQIETTKDLSDAKKELLEIDKKFKEEKGLSILDNENLPIKELAPSEELELENKLKIPLEKDELEKPAPADANKPKEQEDATAEKTAAQSKAEETETLKISQQLKMKLAGQHGLKGTEYEMKELKWREGTHGDENIDKFLEKQKEDAGNRTKELSSMGILTSANKQAEYQQSELGGQSKKDAIDHIGTKPTHKTIGGAFEANKDYYKQDIENKLDGKKSSPSSQEESKPKDRDITRHPGYIDLKPPKPTSTKDSDT